MENWIISGFLLSFIAGLAALDHFAASSFAVETSENIAEVNLIDFSWGFLLFFSLVSATIFTQIN